MLVGSFFTTSDGAWFTPTDNARGPWDVNACHAGPPTGLMARATERLVPEQQLVRLLVEVTRPIPMTGFEISAVVVRVGRRATTTTITVIDGDGGAVASASAMHIAGRDAVDIPTASSPTPPLVDAVPGAFPFSQSSHKLPWFTSAMETRYPPCEDDDSGPTRVWARTVPLLPDEEPSPFQRLCPLADCGNAISRNAEPDRFAFINSDLTISVHRPPVGEWIGSDSISRWEPNGIGISDSLLFDEIGPVGRAVQSLLVQDFG